MVWCGLAWLLGATMVWYGVVVWRGMGLVRRVGWHGGGLAWHGLVWRSVILVRVEVWHDMVWRWLA